MGGDHVSLVANRSSDEDFAVLEDGGGVPENEIDGAVDLAVAVELAEGVEEERVLITFYCAPIYDGKV